MTTMPLTSDIHLERPPAASLSTALLCLACSSCLPPRPRIEGDASIFLTPCCTRPICPACINSNPRLTRYNPCLSCLAGVDAISSSSRTIVHQNTNVDGGLRDEDAFRIGDDEDESDGTSDGNHDTVSLSSIEHKHDPSESPSGNTHDDSITIDSSAHEGATVLPGMELSSEATPSNLDNTKTPSKYYIRRGDTLNGIALRFNVDARHLCKLNNLPPSTLTTTPHLLHTRAIIDLPSGINQGNNGSSYILPENLDREARLARERAAKRLQMFTKETDWRVARAYIALSEGETAETEDILKGKEGTAPVNASLEGRAIDRYLDDEEWERQEQAAGRKADLKPFPFSSPRIMEGEGDVVSTDRRWWRW